MVVTTLDVVPRSIGFGRVSPGRTWESVAEVAGQVTWVADELRDGHVVTAGSELLRIEDANYRLILAQAEAQLQASEVKQRAAREGLVLAKKNLTLLQTEYSRLERLAAKGTISKNTLESTERQLLAGETQIVNLQNALDLSIAEHQVLIAQQSAAKLDLQRTVITAPFDVRIIQVNIGTAQYANRGELLFTADGLALAEVEAQFSVGILRPLIQGVVGDNPSNIRAGATRLNAKVHLRTATHSVEWPARVDRVAGTIDPQTQTIGVIVAIDQPYASAIPGQRPPLRRDTFVEVELYSPPIRQQIVIPLNAIHDGQIYIINSDNRLEKRKIKIDFSQQGYAVIAQGLEPDERIVISDLVTAVEGMLLTPQEDKKSRRQMVMEATGKEPKQ
ncbi:MAG: efflux RND transporter periplasmic adaptor subunit [Candidatus Polarisedimenticolaceae bacterium]|nr:efflux RND transporter periplasmic adaptor subunit [Candidatus Polarisedimenticolaceae bacterium]